MENIYRHCMQLIMAENRKDLLKGNFNIDLTNENMLKVLAREKARQLKIKEEK